MQLTIPHCLCERCGYTWYPRKPELPKLCPACKSRLWQIPKEDSCATAAR